MATHSNVNPRDLVFWTYDMVDDSSVAVRLNGLGKDDFEAIQDAVFPLSEGTFEGLSELLDAHKPQFDGKKVWKHQRLKPVLDTYLASGYFSTLFHL